MSYPFRDGGLSGAEAASRAIAQIESQVGAHNVAALLIEPIQGEGGFVTPADGFLPALRQWASANGVVFVADEIQSGFCRTGYWFALEHEGVVPDLVATAKGLAGGMPLAGVTGRAELMNAVHEGGLGGTYGGNPVAAAASLATIGVLRDRDLAARARELGDVMLAGAARAPGRRAPSSATCAGAARWSPSSSSSPARSPPTPPRPRPSSATATSRASSRSRCGTWGNVIRLLPPLVITDEQLADGLGVLAAAVRAAS